eukprot:TRINITY_DN1698_c0_g1_i1.p1 TRINITY_DN1698_c0_g1~~TRINITY_DN1698_c0_g1_i1.p1  ORF type:complete len:462 (-),score=117.18 TRINITY_DN1698_c0_g1_i1:86-1342(-)
MSNKEIENEGGIWKSILQKASKEKYSVPSKTVLLLGDRGSGKAALITKIHRLDYEDSITKGMGLDFSYDDVYDKSQDLIGRINYWRLEGDDLHKYLISFVINEQTIENSLIIITLDLSTPWNLVESLNKWLKISSEAIENALNKLPEEKKQQFQQRMVTLFQSYIDPQHTEENSSTTTNTHTAPLTEGALLENLGIPILVVLCKAENSEKLEKENGYKDSEFEYIQQHLRRITLKYGASLIYTSAKKDINCTLTKEYIEHLSFKKDFKTHAQVVDKNEIFVPIGWDSNAKIKIDFDNQKLCSDPEKPFEQVIKPPSKKQSEEKILVSAENEQAFLLRHSSVTPTLMRQDSGSVSLSSPLQNLKSTKVNSEPIMTPTTKPTVPSSPQTPSSDTDHEKLANFFNSLINKKKTPNKKNEKK